MHTKSIENVADILYHAATSKIPCLPIRHLLPTGSIEEAYQVQAIGIEKQVSLGHHLLGKKIGLTNPAVQLQLGVNEPDFGALMTPMQVHDEELPFAELIQPKAEAEWAFVLSQPIEKPIATIAELPAYIDYALVAIEVVGSRVKNWDIQITDTVADNASASHFVLGTQKIAVSDIDFINCKAKLYKNGELASEGTGKACMGNPLIALQWLAHKMIELKTPLKKGEIILSGALGPMVNIQQGDELKVTIDAFEAVHLRIS